ncbi:peptidoglycan DD-metalloendopeptidase family protein [Diaminobutyricibacter tongyongensis]|uniref:Peptidoglycan DD-metalloendopeptidase family protein n=2 Tax=Leifsonia tongyongensis TaxID=1268043 RepID=A0A6L9XTL0_9MICO|nr:M23 family metallopeptidase [Diaminobutyricibacter tongyongensis]NEN04646.1 peptidoglycan DD-metalloendopeptidase family protein [Diaminobutyricibacter tongyongensis]
MRRTEPAPGTTPYRFRARGPWRMRAAFVAILAIAAVGSIASPVSPAYATSYPSWQDVQNAKASVSATAAQVARINSLIGQLKAQVAQTQADLVKRGKELEIAEAKLDDAIIKAQQIQAQADESKAKAEAATTQAGRLAAQLYRTGGSDLTASLFLSGNGATTTSPEQLLSDLGSMTKLVERSSDIYAMAKTSQNTAKALADDAAVARGVREKLRAAAIEAQRLAAAAAKAAQVKLAEQRSQMVVMRAQLAALNNKYAKTVAGYQAGVAEAARRAAAAGSGGLPGGYVGPQGWAVPAAGPITDGFGPRASPGGIGSTYHLGIDIGAYCNAPIYAAHEGTVIYAGPLGSYGNFVRIDVGGGIDTGYAHIRDGGILVGVGQHVGAGQPIARVGTTGASTGCHLHYEVRVNGVKIDGIPFMRQRQAPLG